MFKQKQVNKTQLASSSELMREVPTLFWYLAIVSTIWGYGWLIELRPEYWTSLSARTGTLVITALIILVLLISAGVWQLLAWLHRRYLHFSNNLVVYALQWAALWTVFELLRSLALSIFVWGKGSTIGFNWNFGAVGYVLVLTPFKYLVHYVGLYGGSFLVMSCLTLLYCLFALKNLKLTLLVAVGVVISLMGLSWLARPPACLNCQPTVLYVVPLKDNQVPTRLPGSGQARVILLPEYAFVERVDNLAKELGITDQDILIYSDKPSNPTRDDLVVKQGSHELSRVSKQFLIPGGEYLSWLMRGSFQVLKPDLLREFDQTRQVTVHRQKLTPLSITSNGHTSHLGVLICSSVISPAQYRQLTDQGAQVLVNSASIGILKESHFYPIHNQLMAKFIAIANRRPFIQVAKNGQSFIVQPNGQLQTLANSTRVELKVP